MNTEEELRTSEEHLKASSARQRTQSSPFDDQQCILLFNTAVEQVFPCSAEEAIASIAPERFRTLHAEHIRRFGETRVTIRGMGTLGTL